jgi:hypothetical protein
MKKLSVLILSIMLVGSAFLTSCSKSSTTTVNGPNIHFLAGAGYISADQSVSISTPLKFGISAQQGDGKLKRFFVQRTFQGHTATVADSAISATSFTTDLITTAQALAGQEVWVFTIFDNNGGSEAVTLTITTTPVTTYGPITSYTNTILGSWNNSSIGSSFASSNGNVYKLAEAKVNYTLIDWLYYYGATNHATIAAPDDAAAMTVFVGTNGLSSWTHRNDTKFQKVVNAINWSSIQNDSLILIETSGASATSVTSLNVNDVLAFITEAGKKGLIKVTAITGLNDAGTITYDVKVQQ